MLPGAAWKRMGPLIYARSGSLIAGGPDATPSISVRE